MKITIDFETENEAFKENFEYQVKTILDKVTKAITCDNLTAKPIYDFNGNKIGSFQITYKLED